MSATYQSTETILPAGGGGGGSWLATGAVWPSQNFIKTRQIYDTQTHYIIHYLPIGTPRRPHASSLHAAYNKWGFKNKLKKRP